MAIDRVNTVIDRVEAGDNEIIKVNIESGQKLAVGTVLGVKTADGKYKQTAITSTDGSEEARAVLYQPIDTSATGANADTLATAIVGGRVRKSKLIFSGTENISSKAANKEPHRLALQNYSITVLDDDVSVGLQDNQ